MGWNLGCSEDLGWVACLTPSRLPVLSPPIMAKAGAGKGNAFASPGLSYPHLALVRQDGQRNAAEQAALRSPEEDRIVNLADVILDLSARRRVKSDI